MKLQLWPESCGQNQVLNHQCWVGFLIRYRPVSDYDGYTRAAPVSIARRKCVKTLG